MKLFRPAINIKFNYIILRETTAMPNLS